MDNGLQVEYLFGGEIKSLGKIIQYLQKVAPSPQCVDRYLQGFLRNNRPANHRPRP